MLRLALLSVFWSMVSARNCAAPAAGVEAVTCAALADLYAATSGTGWRVATGWTVTGPADYCSAYGLACSAAGVLTYLCVPGPRAGRHVLLARTRVGRRRPCLLADALSSHLNSNLLVGSLPASLGNLTGLASISLASNLLSGTVPATLSSLSALTFLSLQDSVLTGLVPTLSAHTVLLGLNRLDPTSVPPALCAAACASVPDAFACPALPAMASACAPTCASLPCAPPCPVAYNLTDGFLVSYACQGAFSSCTGCVGAAVFALVEHGLSLSDPVTLGRCITQNTPLLLQMGASPVALDGMRSCVPVTCPVTLNATAFASAAAACPAGPGGSQSCNSCFAALLAPFAAASPSWPAINLATVTKEEYSLVSTCLYMHTAALLAAGFSVQTLEALVPCLVVAQPDGDPQPSSQPEVSQGGIAGIVIGGVVFCLLLGMGVVFYLASRQRKAAAAKAAAKVLEMGGAPASVSTF